MLPMTSFCKCLALQRFLTAVPMTCFFKCLVLNRFLPTVEMTRSMLAEGGGESGAKLPIPLPQNQAVGGVISTKKRSEASFAGRNLFYNVITSLCPKFWVKPRNDKFHEMFCNGGVWWGGWGRPPPPPTTPLPLHHNKLSFRSAGWRRGILFQIIPNSILYQTRLI